MSATDFEDLKRHIGHKIVCVGYGRDGKGLTNSSVECETCQEVLLSYDEEPEEEDYEFKQCGDCVHKDKKEPRPCSSCEQPDPTNLTHEDYQEEIVR